MPIRKYRPDDQTRRRICPHHHLYARADWRFAAGWAVSGQLNYVADRNRPFGDTRPQIPHYTFGTLRSVPIKRSMAGIFPASIRNAFDADIREPSKLSSGITFDLPCLVGVSGCKPVTAYNSAMTTPYRRRLFWPLLLAGVVGHSHGAAVPGGGIAGDRRARTLCSAAPRETRRFLRRMRWPNGPLFTAMFVAPANAPLRLAAAGGNPGPIAVFYPDIGEPYRSVFSKSSKGSRSAPGRGSRVMPWVTISTPGGCRRTETPGSQGGDRPGPQRPQGGERARQGIPASSPAAWSRCPRRNSRPAPCSAWL